jgi:hypothetical protein
MTQTILKILVIVLTALEAPNAVKQTNTTVKAVSAHQYSAKCWKICSKGLHF